MNRTETLKILSIFKAAYPSYYKDIIRVDADGVVNLWNTAFANCPYPIWEAAALRFIISDTKGFPPVIGQVMEQIHRIKHPQEMTEQEAFNFVRKGARNSYYNSKEEFDKLPEGVKEIIGSPNRLRELSMLDPKELDTVVASNFMRSYRQRAAEIREYEKLPEEFRRMSQEWPLNIEKAKESLSENNKDLLKENSL